MFQEICRIDQTLRPYQQRAKEEIFSSWDNCENVLFQMPTGTGKTRLFTSIISDIRTWSVIHKQDVKILLIAHRIELIEQISESLTKYKIWHGIIAGGKERNFTPQVQVASIQTLMHRCNTAVAQDLNFDFIIIDEAHHAVANSYKKLWEFYPNAKKLGVTATPWRMNNSGFKTIFDKLILTPSIKDFINEGWLAPYTYFSVKIDSGIQKKIDAIDEVDIEGDFKISALEREMDNQYIRAQLLDSYQRFAKGKKGIIYSISRAHSDHICEEYRSAGINIVRIDSKTPRDERTLHVKRFKEGLIDIIVNVDIFSEGFDCPDIEFIQLARPTKSLVKYLQQVGRGLRPTTGKQKCLILDNVGLYNSFGLPDQDRDWDGFFEGVTTAKTTSSRSDSPIERIYEPTEIKEGDDELILVQDIPITDNGNSNISNLDPGTAPWSETDDLLLRTLFLDKKCAVELLEQVFKKDAKEIEMRISFLGLGE